MVDGEDESSGRVEISHDGIWGTICDYAWNQPDAKVICRYMGYVDGQALPRGEIGGGRGPIWVNGFFCKGTEDNLMSCLSAGWNTTFLSSNCRSHSRDAAVRCYNQTLSKLSTCIDNHRHGKLHAHGQFKFPRPYLFDTDISPPQTCILSQLKKFSGLGRCSLWCS